MDKYRLVEEKIIGAHGFIDHNERNPPGDGGKVDTQYTVRITQQVKPRSCITTAMNMLVR